VGSFWIPAFGSVEKTSKRHSEKRSDVAISLVFNVRNCFAVTHNNEKRAFSTSPFAGMTRNVIVETEWVSTFKAA